MRALSFLGPALLLLNIACGNEKTRAGAAADQQMIQYLAGLELLAGARLGDEEMARHYAKLCEITGVSADQATAFLASHRESALEWKKIHDTITATLKNPENPKKETTDGE